MSQSSLTLLQTEKQQFGSAFDQLSQQLHSTANLLHQYYQQACEQLQSGKFIFNTSIVKELKMYLSQITKIAKLAGSGPALFLLSMNSLHQEEQPQQIDIEKYIDKYRDQTELPFRKWNLQDKHITRIKSRCNAVTSLTLISNPHAIEQIINDNDLIKIKPFAKISRLSLKGSNVSDSGLSTLTTIFQNLKEIDISDCRLVGNEGVKNLLGYKYVSIKMNGCEGVSQRAILSLISTSYNLNYFQISNIKHCNYKSLLQQISEVYSNNKINFKWLQLICNLGTNLFLNKLSYLTHLTNAESITDREVQILLGDQPLIDGLYFNCCQELHSDTVGYIIEHCSKLKRLTLRRFLNLTDALVGDIVAQLVRLESLNLSQCYEVTSRSLIQIANQLNKLKEINLFDCHNIQDEGVMYLIEKMPTLLSINLSNCRHITDRVIYHISNYLPSLLSLNLERCDQITNQSILYLSQKLTLLEELVLNYCEHITDDSLCLVAMRQRKLKRLEIEWCQVTQKCISFIAENMNELQIVNFNYCPSVCDQSFTSLAKHTVKLQVLKLQSCDKLTTRAFTKLFGALKRLRHLDLKECIGVSDGVIEQLCNSSRGELMHLDLSWCSQITDKGILSLSQFQPQLLFLSLNGCSSISDSALGWICTTMTQLQYLNLTLCEKLTDLSIAEISKNLFALRNLYLCDLRSLTDSSVSLLSNIPNLQQLHLSGCIQISSSSLIALLHNLQKLQCLNISQCSNIFTQSLYFLVERMRNLKKFAIASLEVNDQLIQMVGEHMQRLQCINLEYCRNLTDSAVVKMMESIPCLIKIELQNTQITEKTKQIIFEQLSSRSAHYLNK